MNLRTHQVEEKGREYSEPRTLVPVVRQSTMPNDDANFVEDMNRMLA